MAMNKAWILVSGIAVALFLVLLARTDSGLDLSPTRIAAIFPLRTPGTRNAADAETGTRDWDAANPSIISPELPITTRRYNTSYRNPCWNEANDGSEGGEKLYCLPYFFLAGFPKSGTTDLYAKLVWHPDIAKPKTKEPHWWTRGRFLKIGNKRRSREFYRDFFARAVTQIKQEPDAVTLDASASTIWDNSGLFGDFKTPEPDPPKLNAHYIHDQLPDAKCVVIIRNPVTRLYSDYLYFHKKDIKSPKSFHHMLINAIDLYKQCLDKPENSEMYCLYSKLPKYDMASELLRRLRIGLYYFHIKHWLSAFSPDQLMVVRLEDYSPYPAPVLKEIYAFLGVRGLPEKEIQRYIDDSRARNTNTHTYKRAGDMLNETRHILSEFYRPYNQKLAELLGDKQFLYEDS